MINILEALLFSANSSWLNAAHTNTQNFKTKRVGGWLCALRRLMPKVVSLFLTTEESYVINDSFTCTSLMWVLWWRHFPTRTTISLSPLCSPAYPPNRSEISTLAGEKFSPCTFYLMMHTLLKQQLLATCFHSLRAVSQFRCFFIHFKYSFSIFRWVKLPASF